MFSNPGSRIRQCDRPIFPCSNPVSISSKPENITQNLAKTCSTHENENTFFWVSNSHHYRNRFCAMQDVFFGWKTGKSFNPLFNFEKNRNKGSSLCFESGQTQFQVGEALFCKTWNIRKSGNSQNVLKLHMQPKNTRTKLTETENVTQKQTRNQDVSTCFACFESYPHPSFLCFCVLVETCVHHEKLRPCFLFR